MEGEATSPSTMDLFSESDEDNFFTEPKEEDDVFSTPEEDPFMDIFSEPQETDFARLVPRNPSAEEAFDRVLDYIVENSDDYNHSIKFIRLTSIEFVREYSVDTDDEGTSAPPPSPRVRSCGYLVMNFDYFHPNDVRGWRAGTERVSKHGQFEWLLAPPTEEWRAKGLSSNQFLIFISQRSHQTMLEANHTMKINNRVLRKKEICVLHDGDLISIGDCEYTFGYTPRTHLAEHRSAFYEYMDFTYANSRRGWVTVPRAPTWNDHIFWLGKDYYCEAAAWKAISDGKEGVGWSKFPGTPVVVVKRLQQDTATKFSGYQGLMHFVDQHEYVVHLEDITRGFDGSMFSIHSPPATGTLQFSLQTHDIPLSTTTILARDWACGLAYLHSRGLIHRDIQPANLSITDYREPRGFIAGLDVAAQATWTHGQVGNRTFWAPERCIAGLAPRNRDADTLGLLYDKGVDVWALGLCLYMMLDGQAFEWRDLDDDDGGAAEEARRRAKVRNSTAATAAARDDLVTWQRWQNLQDHLREIMTPVIHKNLYRIHAICKQMLDWLKIFRVGAAEVGVMLEELARKYRNSWTTDRRMVLKG